jgi:hypothetical protein
MRASLVPRRRCEGVLSLPMNDMAAANQSIPETPEQAAWQLWLSSSDTLSMAQALRRAERAFHDLELWRSYRSGAIDEATWKSHVESRAAEVE